MAARKAKVEMYWTTEKKSKDEIAAEKAAQKVPGPVDKTRDVINWRLVGANGEVMCQSTQGYTSRQSARESMDRCGYMLHRVNSLFGNAEVKGPGRKPVKP